MSREWQVGIFGTFDVANYGDLLFPILAEAELTRRLGAITLHRFSYHGKTPPEWPYEVTSLTRLPDIAGDEVIGQPKRGRDREHPAKLTAAQNTDNRIAQGAEVKVFQHRTRRIATQRASDQLDDQIHIHDTHSFPTCCSSLFRDISRPSLDPEV